nr:hypothetical protein [Tanacetum cinerariifolium]
MIGRSSSTCVGYSFAGGTDPITCVFSDLTGSDFLIGDIHTVINLDTDLQKTYVPQWSVTNGSRLDDSRVCREMVDEFAPPKFFASIREMEHDHLFTEFNVRAARQMSLSDEVRMRAEYNIKEKRRLKSVVDEQAEFLKVREKEIENLKVQLSLEEAEATEAIHLRAQASELETVERSLRDETNALKERNVILEKERDALDVKVIEIETLAIGKERELADLNALVTSVKSHNDNFVDRVHELEVSSFGLQEKVIVYENCMEQLEKFQDDQMKVVNDKFDNLHTDFVEMTLHLEEWFHLHLLTTISGRRWLLTHGMELAIAKYLNSPEYLSALGAAISKALEKGMQDGLVVGITHGKEGRVLTDVAAHNPSAKADYISALRQLQNVNFPLLAELKTNKDASVESIMEILCREDLVAEKLRLNELQPNVHQLMVPIHNSPDKVVIGAIALSLAFDASTELFSTATLTSMEDTPDVVPATAITTALSTTLALTSTVNPISIDDYEFVDANDHAVAGGDAASFPVIFCYGLFASLTSYGPTHLGPSFPVSSAWLASLLRYIRSRLIPRASSFCTRSTFVVLNVGMPIPAGMTASVPYVNKNGVSPLLDFIMVWCA